MASNVFGTPVTNETLEGLQKYHNKKPTQTDRARVALEMKNAEGKDANARKFVERLQQRYEGKSTAMCLIYNATGKPLIFYNHHYWRGGLGESSMPPRIENGQWGAFLFGDAGEETTRGAVIYTTTLSEEDVYYRCCFCWNTSADSLTNTVFTQIGTVEELEFNEDGTSDLDAKLSSSGYFCGTNYNELYMFASIGNTPNTVMEGICTLNDVWNCYG